MPFTFAKKAAGAAQAQAPAEPSAGAAPSSGATKFGAKASAPSDKPKVSFLARGAASKKMVQEHEAKIEARKELQGKMYRFRLPYNKDGQITFLDGKLDDDGMLDVPRWREHFLKIGGDNHRFVCTAKIDTSQPCPICETGDEAALVGALTVVDHSEFTVKTGPNAGKVYRNQRRLFVAKDTTLKTLSKYANKPERMGLTLCTFDVSRGPENKHPPAVGDTFDFVVKHESYAAFAKKLGVPVDEVQPAAYDEEIVYLEPTKLIEMGIGKKPGGVGYEKGVDKSSDEM